MWLLYVFMLLSIFGVVLFFFLFVGEVGVVGVVFDAFFVAVSC